MAIATDEAHSEADYLCLIAALEQQSEHPLARAVVASATQRGLSLPPTSDFTALPGRGYRATIGATSYFVGGPQLLSHTQASVPSALADTIRPESRQAVSELRAQGIEIAMLTGDAKPVAAWVAKELGITTVFAQVLPEDKVAKIAELQRGARRVAMVGDGVNDAAALAQANVGIAIGAGTDVARAAAGIILVRNDPRDISRIVRLSRATYRKMVQNLGWAIGYNLIALPLAAGVAAPLGLILPAWVGAVLMSLSTIIVAANAQLLRRTSL